MRITSGVLSIGIELVENINSKEAFDILKEDESSLLIDVRTKKEHLTVGIPNLKKLSKEVVKIEWKNSILFSSRNQFLSEFRQKLGVDHGRKYIFICRSGIRSKFAALTVEESLNSGNYKSGCFNVEDGFEGHSQSFEYSREPTGWKNLGLPWMES